MAYTTTHDSAASRGAISGLFATIADTYARAAAYRRTFNALDRLSDQHLNDIGVDRFQIEGVARRSAGL